MKGVNRAYLFLEALEDHIFLPFLAFRGYSHSKVHESQSYQWPAESFSHHIILLWILVYLKNYFNYIGPIQITQDVLLILRSVS